jgi:hypothetical protein
MAMRITNYYEPLIQVRSMCGEDVLAATEAAQETE